MRTTTPNSPGHSAIHLSWLLSLPLAWIAGMLVRIPVDDPWGVGGRLVALGYSPANNVLRFLFFLAAPVLLLIGLRALRGKGFAAAAAPVSRPGEPSPRTHRRLAALTLAVALLGALNLPTPRASGPLDTFHEGEALGAAVSHLHGDVPYRDYLPFHGLWQDPLRAVASFSLFGRSIGSLRTLETIQKLVVHLLFALLVLRLFRGWPRVALAVGALFAVAFTVPKAIFETEGYLLYPPTRDILPLAWLLAVGALFPSDRTNRPGSLSLFLAGLLPPLALAVSVDRGIYLLVAAALVLPPLLASRSRQPLRDAAILVAGASAGSAALLVLLGEGRGEFVRFVFGELPQYKDLLDGLVFPLGKPRHLLTLALFAGATHLATLALLRRVEADGSWSRGAGRLGRERGFELTVLVLGIFVFRNALNRGDGDHLAYSSALGLLAAARLLFVEFEEGGWPVAGVVAVLRRLVAPVAIGLVGVGLAGLVTTTILAESFPVGRDDRDFLPAGWAVTLEAIEKELRPGESFFTLSSEGTWYYCLDLPPATRFFVPWWAAPRRYQDEMVRDLEASAVALVLVRNGNWSCRIDNIETLDRLPLVRAWLERNYVPWQTIGGNEIRIRRERPAMTR